MSNPNEKHARPPLTRSANDPDLPDLIARSLDGDQSAYATLYNRHAPGLYRLAFSILLVEQDAEDVIQESMVYAFRNLDRYDPARGAFRTWLYTITVSRCRNARRRKWLPTVALTSLLNIGIEPSTPADQSPEVRAAWSDLRVALAEALGTLSPRLREAIALRYGQGLTYREMAEIIGCPQKTAESRVRLAHEQLRRAMSAADQAALEELWTI
ncbi:MAG: RNA polymerase sigma factor [Anaerolineae bacterium]|jgi:RNA polymerase sigma-70 factor (ECF subfamily)|nr:RNA polymerase sigma factor [Anaerolineae bacterium]